MQEKTTKILVGLTDDNLIVYANLHLNKDYFSITHDTLRELITEEEGEERAREYLEDGELWKQAVETDNTTDSLENWIEMVLNMDGWQTVMDANDFGEYEGIDYYSLWDSCGACIDDFKANFVFQAMPQSDIDTIIESDTLHLKDFKKYTQKDKILFEKIKEIIKKYENQEDCNKKIIEKYLNNN